MFLKYLCIVHHYILVETWLLFSVACIPCLLTFIIFISLSFLPFCWAIAVGLRLCAFVLCRENCPFSFWCHAWKKFFGVLWWKRRRWTICWIIKVGTYCFCMKFDGCIMICCLNFSMCTIIHIIGCCLCIQLLLYLHSWHFPSSDIIWPACPVIIFSPFLAGRYHSLVIEKESFPHEELQVTAWTDDGLIMAARHKKYRHLQVTFLFFLRVFLWNKSIKSSASFPEIEENSVIWFIYCMEFSWHLCSMSCYAFWH